MKIYFLTLFPDFIHSSMEVSILGRALKNRVYSYEAINVRNFAFDSHKSVDDHPYGGGAGMVMRADVLERCLLSCFEKESLDPTGYNRNSHNVIVTSASGAQYRQKDAVNFSLYQTLFIVCGHYEGIDQRFVDMYADQEVRIGNYVLTGGELPALVMADSIVRLLPGVLGSHESIVEESFSFSDDEGLLFEYPHYTRPAVFHDQAVPEVLISGNHAAITAWRLEKAKQTRSRRQE